MDLARACRAWRGCTSDSPRVVRTIVLLAAVWCLHPVAAETPLHDRIDQAMSELHPGPEVALCSDGEFLRRVYLDLLGRIPTAKEAREFIDDADPDKRAQVVDLLLDHPEHDRQMAEAFDVMLMERRPDKYVKKDEWKTYLTRSLREDKPLNQLAAEILGADGTAESGRGPAKFFLEREGEPNLLTREVGRMFFGMDLQCAQCHDHPTVYDYYQSDYYGLFAFVNRSYLFQPDKKKPAVLAEKAEGDAKYKSVFTDEEGSTLPRLPGELEIHEPTFAKDDAYKVKPDPKKKDVRPIPKYSRLAQLALRATNGSNRAFNRNLANRLWAYMMGRGLVHPVDQHHSANPPAHPALLEMLADELPKNGFDLNAMLRGLALSRTYQRSLDLPIDLSPSIAAARTQTQTWNGRLQSTRQSIKEIESSIAAVEQTYQQATQNAAKQVELEKNARAKLVEETKSKEEATAKFDQHAKELADLRSAAKFLSEAVAQASKAADLVEDPKLDESIKQLDARRVAAATLVSSKAEQSAALTTAKTDAIEKWNSAKRSVDQVVAKADEIQKTIRQASSDLVSQREQLRFQQNSETHARAQIDRFKVVVAYGDALEEQSALVNQIQKNEGRLKELETLVVQRKPERNRLEKELPVARSAQQAAAKQADSLRKERDRTRVAADLVSVSLEKASEAAALIAEDDQLQQTVASLQTNSRSFVEKLAGQEKQLADSTKTAKGLEAKARALAEQFKRVAGELESAEREQADLKTSLDVRPRPVGGGWQDRAGQSRQADRRVVQAVFDRAFAAAFAGAVGAEHDEHDRLSGSASPKHRSKHREKETLEAGREKRSEKGRRSSGRD